MIDKFSILNGERHISSGIFQNDLVFIPQLKNAWNILVALLGFDCGNLMECHKKVLKIWLNQTSI